ncbi:MAG: hypothetical protein KKB50_10015 [Planctomycetes bacterium]|nr:hypothetical protein [Planctomycetota bacterium]
MASSGAARRFGKYAAGLGLLGLVCCAAACRKPQPAATSSAALPVVYCSDLFHPHDDPDDHFDLASIFALSELDLKAVILDQGRKQQERPGATPLTQLMAITGRPVPYALGLAEPLSGPDDQGLEQPAEFQGGVTLMLRVLEQSPRKVVIMTLGSVRDLVAAYNRRPDLFRARVDRVYTFIGEAAKAEVREYNVGLDVNAFVGLLRADMPLYWVPCFDGGVWKNNGRASFWVARHEDLLNGVSDSVCKYFTYALGRCGQDPLAYLQAPLDPRARAQIFGQSRNLWGSGVFALAFGRQAVRTENGYRAVVSAGGAAPPPLRLFDFVDVNIAVSDDGVVSYGRSERSRVVKQFRILDRDNYARAMTDITAQLLSELP